MDTWNPNKRKVCWFNPFSPALPRVGLVDPGESLPRWQWSHHGNQRSERDMREKAKRQGR